MVTLFIMYLTWVPVPPGQMGDNNMPPVVELRYDSVEDCNERRDFLNNFWAGRVLQGQATHLKAFCVGEGATNGNVQYNCPPAVPGDDDVCWISPQEAPELCNCETIEPPPISYNTPPGQENNGWPSLSANPTAPGLVTRNTAWYLHR